MVAVSPNDRPHSGRASDARNASSACARHRVQHGGSPDKCLYHLYCYINNNSPNAIDLIGLVVTMTCKIVRKSYIAYIDKRIETAPPGGGNQFWLDVFAHATEIP
jgi:hypothetical protein